ncbi:MAG: tetratricopeptide repeat protein [Verrucomicrobiaceae bacterium]|nr:tetratricopeptide repeat protein [Verrucomicrobiaceae bacterium]
MPDSLESARSTAAKAREAAAADPAKFPALVNALQLVGDALRDADIAAAEAAYREAIESAEGKELPVGVLANVRMNLATLLDFNGREEEATLFYENAITDFEALDTKDSKEVAAQLRNNLAMTYKGLGKFALAEQHYLRALETLEANHGRKSEAVATLFNNLGGLYYVAGFPDQAKDMFADALEVRVNVLGPEHRDVAQAHSNLGTACHELRENEAAKEHFENALRILEGQIQQEARSFEATSLDYIAMLELIHEEAKAAEIKSRLEAALTRVS